nr:LppX_LprAFG lipoprotein [Nocardiopsis mwathae]
MGEFLTGVDPEALSTFTILKADDEVYLKNPHGIHGDADWVTVASKKDLEEMPDIDFQAFVVLTEVLAGAEDVADDGTEEINGQETTKFAGSLTQKDIDAVDDAEKSAALEEFFDEKIADKVDFEVWADADSVPHRITMKEGDDEMKLEFSDFGKVSFDLPADDEIGEMEA